ncbi:MAG TPA: aminotransferase class I/II-fold pyridoxal phosphate-dependent enzyme [Terracidiphilus sp.]|nr:aminotransferase class I/II-fold pyridoxal phosphate-dependent enzyme [Terracidiphilus sp.]
MPTDSVPGLLARATKVLEAEFGSLPEFSAATESGVDLEAMARVLEATAHRLGDNYPYFHPLYAGQMLKPPHPVARAAYALAMTINPNNHALDGGRASSEMEIEAVAEIAAMFGWTEFLGHLTSSGTIANLEALWIAGQLAPGRRIVGSEQAHYTHQRISAVLKLEYGSIAADQSGRMSLEALETDLRKGDVGTVVVTLGTTAIGAVDPLGEILSLRERYGFRVHVDAAYGGYFKLIADALDEPARKAYAVIDRADSIVVDPHKHGLQPYGCGCVLFRDPAVGRFYKHDSPYTYFTSKELQLRPGDPASLAGGPVHLLPSKHGPLAGGPVHLGEISLECSRAGAAAVALWATQKLLPLKPDGEFAHGLAKGRSAALEMDRRLRADERFQPLRAARPELDIVVWKMNSATPETCSQLAQKEFDACAARKLHLALVQLPRSWFEATDEPPSGGHAKYLTCLRSVLMKPEHERWLDIIWDKIDAASTEILKVGNQ